LTQGQHLEKLLNYWANVLHLGRWYISWHPVEEGTLKDAKGAAAAMSVETYPDYLRARISITWPPTAATYGGMTVEFALTHELLHVQQSEILRPLDALIDKAGVLGAALAVAYDATHGATEQQAQTLAHVLMHLRYPAYPAWWPGQWLGWGAVGDVAEERKKWREHLGKRAGRWSCEKNVAGVRAVVALDEHR